MVFLGHILSADGLSANPEKVEKLREWLVPENFVQCPILCNVILHK